MTYEVSDTDAAKELQIRRTGAADATLANGIRRSHCRGSVNLSLDSSANSSELTPACKTARKMLTDGDQGARRHKLARHRDDTLRRATGRRRTCLCRSCGSRYVMRPDRGLLASSGRDVSGKPQLFFYRNQRDVASSSARAPRPSLSAKGTDLSSLNGPARVAVHHRRRQQWNQPALAPAPRFSPTRRSS